MEAKQDRGFCWRDDRIFNLWAWESRLMNKARGRERVPDITAVVSLSATCEYTCSRTPLWTGRRDGLGCGRTPERIASSWHVIIIPYAYLGIIVFHLFVLSSFFGLDLHWDLFRKLWHFQIPSVLWGRSCALVLKCAQRFPVSMPSSGVSVKVFFLSELWLFSPLQRNASMRIANTAYIYIYIHCVGRCQCKGFAFAVNILHTVLWFILWFMWTQSRTGAKYC